MSKDSLLLFNFNGFCAADSRIDVGDDWQVRWWCNHYGCSKIELLAAVRAGGPSTERVGNYLAQAARLLKPAAKPTQASQDRI